MDTRHFDALVKALSLSDSRRRLLALLATLPVLGGLLGMLASEDARGRRRGRRRKRQHHHGKGRRRKKHKKCTSQSVAQTCAGKCGAVANNCKKSVDCGPCDCIPTTCAAEGTTCGTISDGCGGELACGACEGFTLCHENTCHACAAEACLTGGDCAAALTAALTGPEPVLYFCPGTYSLPVGITRSLTIIGAGQDEDPATNTILTGNNTRAAVGVANSTGTVTLQNLHITGGRNMISAGAGVANSGTNLVMQDCTVAANHGVSGSGVAHLSGTLEMTRCTVRDNVGEVDGSAVPTGAIFLKASVTLTDCEIFDNDIAGPGGGIYMSTGSYDVSLLGESIIRKNTATSGGGIMQFGGALTIAETCRITENEATSSGGGINSNNGTVTLQGADPSPIVVANCPQNCVGSVAKCAPGGTCPP